MALKGVVGWHRGRFHAIQPALLGSIRRGQVLGETRENLVPKQGSLKIKVVFHFLGSVPRMETSLARRETLNDDFNLM